jgi:hypothetical protein
MSVSDGSGISDEITVSQQTEEVKGPDAEVWGEEHASATRITPIQPGESLPVLLAPGEKGPDPAVWGEEHAALAITNPQDAED